jgi:NAD(P)H-hydrate repair Nnr-like enzyme with NAD(P)H-hydrate dehydratase domain
MAACDAAALGARAHGRAGDLWAAAHGCGGMTPRELADRLPEAMEALRAEAR